MIVFILLLIIIILVISNNSTIDKLRKENKKLKKQVEVLSEYIKKYIPSGNAADIIKENKANFIENQKEINTKTEIIKNENIYEKDAKKLNIYEKNKLEEKEQEKKRVVSTVETKDYKNIAILLTGAILIVLSAIVFLLSTWYTIPNILKTAVLLCLAVVFLGASNIAKNKFKLEKASTTFFFIAMAYIPICLYSISIFGLFGEYLSIYGEGRNIYLAISGLIISVIYYICYKIKNNKILMYGSILAQELSVILLSLVLKVNENMTLINLCLYNLLVMLFTNASKDRKIFITFGKIVAFVLLILAIFSSYTEELYYIFFLIALAINFLYLEINESKKVYSYVFNFLYILLGFNFTILHTNFSNLVKEIIILSYILVGYFTENILLIGKNRGALKEASLVTSIIGLIFCYLSFDFIKPYIMSLIIVVMLLIAYRKSKEIGKNISAFLIPIFFILTGITFFDDLELSYHFYILFSIVTFALSEFISGNENEILKKYCRLISHVFIVLVYMSNYILNYKIFKNDVLYVLILFGIYLYSYVENRNNKIFKYLAYATSNLVLLSGFYFFKISVNEIYNLIPLITTIGIIILENNYKDLEDEFSFVYLAISKITSFILVGDLGKIGLPVNFGFAGYLIYDNITKQKKDSYNIIPLLGVLFTMLNTEVEENILMLISLVITVGVSVLSMYRTKFNVYTLFSFIYLVCTMNLINIKIYNEILFILWILLHTILEKDEKYKDIFKGITYVGFVSFYYTVIEYLKLDKYAIFNVLGALILVINIFKKILYKYVKESGNLEYVFYSIIYIFALGIYSSIEDAMLFLLLLVGTLIYSYIKKYGELFVVTIIALIVNVFCITKEFWLMIPWWIYLLVIGGILISFAARNEASENKEKLSLGKIINKIKDNVEK